MLGLLTFVFGFSYSSETVFHQKPATTQNPSQKHLLQQRPTKDCRFLSGKASLAHQFSTASSPKKMPFCLILHLKSTRKTLQRAYFFELFLPTTNQKIKIRHLKTSGKTRKELLYKKKKNDLARRSAAKHFRRPRGAFRSLLEEQLHVPQGAAKAKAEAKKGGAFEVV